MTKQVIGSLARISDIAQVPWELKPVPATDWMTGDYVAAEVTGERSELYNVEDTGGTMVPVAAQDMVVGALGHRAATLEGVGSFEAVVNGRMHCLTNAGLLGAFTSLSPFLPRPISLAYRGHLRRGHGFLRMQDFALPARDRHFSVPTILLIGSSMSAGKTTTGRVVIETLKGLGANITGAKLTGAGRYRDILSFRRAGAAAIFDFVDAGLPSTVVPEDVFRTALRPLLAAIDAGKPDFLVAEAGASPLEPYNGEAAIDELGDNIRCTILCASDPYAVLGVQQAFDLPIDIVSGPATTTSAGRDLVTRLTGLPSFNIVDAESLPGFRAALSGSLGIEA
jgi:hypothetical protein